MRKVREVLRLKYACGVSARVISRSLGIGRTAVAEYIRFPWGAQALISSGPFQGQVQSDYQIESVSGAATAL
jgi:hypothetical protein